MLTRADVAFQDARGRNVHKAIPADRAYAGEPIRAAYVQGVRDAWAWAPPHCKAPRAAIRELQGAAVSWKGAEHTHAETSYYGRENVRRSRAYWLGCLRSLRAMLPVDQGRLLSAQDLAGWFR